MTKHTDQTSSSILERLRRPADVVYTPTGRESAFFGASHTTQILCVSSGAIKYINSKGIEMSINLKECGYCNEFEIGYIGRRGLLSSPPWVEFFDKKHTRFEFESRKYAYSCILNRLQEMGFKTMDMD